MEIMYIHSLLPLLLAGLVFCHIKMDITEMGRILNSRRLNTRVIGGEQTTNEQIGGFMVAISFLGTFNCGGSLINELTVISAAHCFNELPYKMLYSVIGGISSIREMGIMSLIEDLIIPNDYSTKTMLNDIAIVRLKEPMIGTGIKTVQLCKNPLSVGTILTVAGWGIIEKKATMPETFLRSARLPVLNKTECETVYESVIKIQNSMLCAGYLGKTDACTLDSGGPLVYYGESGPELCGIISFGISCASHKFPGVYTDVYQLKSWILQNMIKAS